MDENKATINLVSKARVKYYLDNIILLITGQTYSVDANAQFPYTPAGRYSDRVYGEGTKLYEYHNNYHLKHF